MSTRLSGAELDLTAAKNEIDRILDAPPADLAGAGPPPVRPPMPPGTWDLPDDDTAALWAYGLPPERGDGLIGVRAAFQTTARPQETLGGSDLYVLGAFGEGRLAAVAGPGTVFYLPTYTEVHPQLRNLYPDGITPSRANSSVSALVDCAWRWHRLLPVLARAETLLGEEEVAWFTAHREEFARGGLRPTGLDRDREAYLDLCRGIVAHFQERDDAGSPDARASASFHHARDSASFHHARDSATDPAGFMWAEVILDLG